MSGRPTYEELERRVKELEDRDLPGMNGDEHRSIVENLQEGIWIIDEKGSTAFVNEPMAQMLGYTQEEMKGRHLFGFMDVAGRAAAEQKLSDRKAGVSEQHEFEFRRKDGSPVSCLLVTTPLQKDDGKYAGAISGVLDISVRKRAEDELRISETHYRTLFHNAAVAMYRIDTVEGKPIEVNEVGARLFGYPSASGFLSEYYAPEHYADLGTRRELLRRLREEGHVGSLRVEYKRKDGSRFWGEYTGFMLEDGRTVDGFILDITKRIEAEEELKRSRQEWEDTFDAMSDWVCVLDAEHIIQRSNTAGQAMTGIDRSELVGMSPCRILHEGESHIPECPFQRMLESKKRESIEVQLGGQWYMVTADPVLTAEKEMIGGVHVVRDISEQKEAEAQSRELEIQLQKARRMEAIGTLAGGIAHDFNNILGIILGNTELAIDDVPAWNPAKVCLEETRSATLRARDVVRQILSFSRQEIRERTPIHVIPLVGETLKLLRASIPASIMLKESCVVDDDVVLADPTQISQVLMNLCLNASQAVGTEGLIEVDLENVESSETESGSGSEGYGSLLIRVRDSGPGIPREDLERVFDPYFTTKEVGEGAGMGLAVAQGIISRLGGEIEAVSQLGQGAEFRFRLPLAGADAILDAATPERLPTGTERVLFVDDEAAIVDAYEKALKSLGYQVIALSDPLEALERFRREPDQIDLLLTDMTMPGISGERLATEAREIRPDLPIILCTGHSEKLAEETAKTLGINAFILKPLVKQDLAVTVREVLDEALGL